MKTQLLFVLLFASLLVLPNTECGRLGRRRRFFYGRRRVPSRCSYSIRRNCNYRKCWWRYCIRYCKDGKKKVCYAG